MNRLTLLKTSIRRSSFLFFGENKIIKSNQIFYETEKSFALCNITPVLPGHVLVSPKKIVQRVHELEKEELADLICSVQLVGKVLQDYYDAEALTINCQDGVAAGQTVPHVHFHILPRKFGDFENKGDVYKKLRVHDKGKEHEWNKRSLEEMKEE